MSGIFPGIVIVLDLVLPVALLAWAFLTRAKSRIYFVSIYVLIAIVLGVLASSIFGFWYVVGGLWPAVYLIAFLVIVVVRVWGGLPKAWLPRKWEIIFSSLNIAHAALWALMIPPLLQARSYEGEPLALSSPLRGGIFSIVAGGANGSVNQHRGYELDISMVNALGMSAPWPFAGDVKSYKIYSAEIVAPCAGEVISTESSRPDQPPFHPDSEDRRGGNHVILFCKDHSVHFAHLQPNSIAVQVGDQVSTGQVLGRVGNSGNTMLPHLHLAAARGRQLFIRPDAESPPIETVPILIDGRFLIKGDSLSD